MNDLVSEYQQYQDATAEEEGEYDEEALGRESVQFGANGRGTCGCIAGLHATCSLQLCALCAARFCVGEAKKLGAARSGSGLNAAFASCYGASIWALHGQRKQECKTDRMEFQAADET